MRRRVPVAVALGVNLALMPGLALVLLYAVRVDGPVALGVMLAAAASGGGSGVLLAQHARADVALSVGLQALLAVLGLAVLPVWLAAADRAGVADLAALPARGAVALVVGSLLAQLAPLATGMALRARRPGLASRIHPVARRTADVLLAGIVVWSVVADAGRLRQVSLTAYAVMAAVVGVGLVSYLVPGLREPGTRAAVSMITTVRNLSLALFVAAFTPDAGQVIHAVLAYGLLMYLGAVAAIGPMRRSAKGPAALSVDEHPHAVDIKFDAVESQPLAGRGRFGGERH